MLKMEEQTQTLSPAKLRRGKEKLAVLKKAEFQEDAETLKWISEQASWADDIAYYENSLKPVKPEKETKSKKEK